MNSIFFFTFIVVLEPPNIGISLREAHTFACGSANWNLNVEGTVYTLNVENGQLGFYRYTGATLSARRAYLVMPGAAAVHPIYIVDGSEDAGISEMTTTQPSQQYYDLQGRHISQPQRGIYIVNGKKMVKQ